MNSVCRIAGKFKIRKPDSIDGNLIRAYCGRRFESRGAGTGYKIVLVNAIAADAEAADEHSVFIQTSASWEKHDTALFVVGRAALEALCAWI
jgi:hypothetical protein